MKSKNSTNLHQVDGGKIIKQNDTQSTFSYELQDENYNRLDSLNGQNATVIFVNEDTRNIVYQKNVIVENGTVTFNVSETIEPNTYIVEVKCGGYIFASDDKIKITITKTAFRKDENTEVMNNDKKLSFDVKNLTETISNLKNINLNELSNIPQNIKNYVAQDLNFIDELKQEINEKIEQQFSSTTKLINALHFDYTDAQRVLQELDNIADIASDIYLENEEIDNFYNAKSIIENVVYDTQNDLNNATEKVRNFIAKVKDVKDEE